MIEKGMFDEVIETFHLTKVCSVKSDENSNDSIQVTLDVKFEGATVRTLAQSNLGQGVVVRWQNGPGRKNHDKLVKGQVIKVDWKSPGRMPEVPPEDAIVAKASAMTKEERAAYRAKLLAQMDAIEE